MTNVRCIDSPEPQVVAAKAQALRAARHVFCLQEGRVALTGEANTITREKIAAAYFGV